MNNHSSVHYVSSCKDLRLIKRSMLSWITLLSLYLIDLGTAALLPNNGTVCCYLRIMFMGQTLWSEISNSDISLFNFAIMSLFLASYINAFIIVPVQCILLFRRNGVIRIRELYVNSLGKILVVLMQDRNHLCDW